MLVTTSSKDGENLVDCEMSESRVGAIRKVTLW